MSAQFKNPKSLALEAGSTAAYFIADNGNEKIRVVRNGIDFCLCGLHTAPLHVAGTEVPGEVELS